MTPGAGGPRRWRSEDYCRRRRPPAAKGQSPTAPLKPAGSPDPSAPPARLAAGPGPDLPQLCSWRYEGASEGGSGPGGGQAQVTSPTALPPRPPPSAAPLARLQGRVRSHRSLPPRAAARLSSPRGLPAPWAGAGRAARGGASALSGPRWGEAAAAADPGLAEAEGAGGRGLTLRDARCW